MKPAPFTIFLTANISVFSHNLLQVKMNTPLLLNTPLFLNRKAKAKYKIRVTQQKIQQDATVYQNLLFHIYMKLNMFRATHHPSSGA